MEVDPFALCEMVERASHPTFESSAIEEDAGSAYSLRLSIIIETDLSDGESPFAIGGVMHLPDIGSEPSCSLHHSLLIAFVGVIGAIAATSCIR
jgi:hypothetical protein